MTEKDLIFREIDDLIQSSTLLAASFNGAYNTLVEFAKMGNVNFLEIFVTKKSGIYFTAYDIALQQSCANFIKGEQEQQILQNIINVVNTQKSDIHSYEYVLSQLELLPNHLKHLRPVVQKIVDTYQNPNNIYYYSDNIINSTRNTSSVRKNQNNDLQTDKYFDEKCRKEAEILQIFSYQKPNHYYTGSLMLQGQDITNLPEGLCVSGSLDLSNTNIQKLPENLTVRGYLSLENTTLTELPNNLTVQGNLFLSYTNIASLPETLRAHSGIYLNESRINKLPNGLYVNGNLYMAKAPIRRLPKGLRVNGSLYLSNTKLKALPDDLIVGEYLYIENTLISQLPDNLQVGKSINSLGTPLSCDIAELTQKQR